MYKFMESCWVDPTEGSNNGAPLYSNNGAPLYPELKISIDEEINKKDKEETLYPSQNLK